MISENEAKLHGLLTVAEDERDELRDLLRYLWEFTGRDQFYIDRDWERRIRAALGEDSA